MPTPADRPLRKVTLNLYESDVIYLQDNIPAWSTWVRDIIAAEVAKAINTGTYRFPLIRRTLGDL